MPNTAFKIESAPDISLLPLKYGEYDLTPHLIPYVSLLYRMMYEPIPEKDIYPLAITGRCMRLDKTYEGRELKNFRAFMWYALYRNTWGDALKIVPDLGVSSKFYIDVMEKASYTVNPASEIQRAAYELTYECLEHHKSLNDVINCLYMSNGFTLDDIKKRLSVFNKVDKSDIDLNALVFTSIIWNSILERFNDIYETNKHKVFRGDTKRIYGGFYFDKYKVDLDDIINRFGANTNKLFNGSMSVNDYFKEYSKSIIMEAVFTMHCKYLKDNLEGLDGSSNKESSDNGDSDNGDSLQGFSEMMLAAKICDPVGIYGDIAIKQFVVSTKINGMTVFELPNKMMEMQATIKKLNGEVRTYQKDTGSLNRKILKLEGSVEKYKNDISNKDDAIRELKKNTVNIKSIEKTQDELKKLREQLNREKALHMESEQSLAELKKENARLIKDMRTFEQYKQVVDSMRAEELSTEEDSTEELDDISIEDCVDILNGLKIGIVNNQPNQKLKIEQLGLKAYIIDQENSANIFRKHDVLVVCTRYTGHPTAIRAQKEAKRNGAFIVNYNGTSVKDMVREVVKQLEEN